tara:strand:- start:1033 stop:2262 length:1230 start_codon:yes stop_codon:yes gene_type:complete
MTDGGLLAKAIEQKTEGVIEADIQTDSNENSSRGFLTLFNSKSMKIGLLLALLGLISGFITSIPENQQQYSFAIILPILFMSGSFFFLWTTFDRTRTSAIAVFCILLLVIPYGITSLDSSSLTIVDDELSDDATQVILKIRESGALFSSSGETADVVVKYDGKTTWSGKLSFSVDREDGIGKYGLISLNVADIYNGNSDDNNQYIVEFKSGDSELTYTLASSSLQRTVTDVQGDIIGAIGTGNDCDNGKESCVVGLAMRSWSGVESLNSNTRPSGIIHSNYNVVATLYYENTQSTSKAISYPSITVINGDATWDSMSGKYGSGEDSNIGDYGSELALPGSVEDSNVGMEYIPMDDLEISDYGCYIFEITTSQEEVWVSNQNPTTSLTYYQYDEGNEGSEEESWKEVNSC